MPVTYQWWEPYYDQLLDVVQPIWHRVAGVGRSNGTIARVVGLVLRLAWRVVWLTVKVLTYVVIASIVVGFGVLYAFLMFAMGQGNVAKSMSGGGRR